jgi:hypothetical protein
MSVRNRKKASESLAVLELESTFEYNNTDITAMHIGIP